MEMGLARNLRLERKQRQNEKTDVCLRVAFPKSPSQVRSLGVGSTLLKNNKAYPTKTLTSSFG